jgi:hypothetical protein
VKAYRLLFPLGVLLGWVGVLPWLFFALGVSSIYEPLNAVLAYRSYFHPIAELEGFAGCFALGLLFAFFKPAWWELLLAVIAPLGAVVLAAAGRWEEGQMLWLLLVACLALRFRGPWIFASLLLGAGGFALASFAKEWWLHELGRDLVMQGMFTALAVSAARRIRGDSSSALHLLAIALFACGFWIATRYDKPHLGFALRGLVLIAEAWPIRASFEVGPRNLHKSFAHLALWLMATGTLWVGIIPSVRRAGLHVIFLGAFTSLLCAGFTQLGQSRGRLAVIAGLFSLAMFGRVMVELDPHSFQIWMGTSAAAFLIATALSALPMPARAAQ